MDLEKGTYTVLVTPFTKNNYIDFPSFKKIIDNQLNCKTIKGLVILGSTGENSTITNIEKLDIIEYIYKYVNKRKKIILGIIAFILLFNLKVHSENKIFLSYKIDNEIITNMDIKNESSYLIALNTQLKTLPEDKILKIAESSLIRETVKKIELLKFIDLDEDTDTLSNIIKNFYTKLNFSNEQDFEKYLKRYDLKLKDVKKKINIETSWNQLIFERYQSQVKINIEYLKKKIDLQKSSENKKSYRLSEILFEKKNTPLNDTFKKIEESLKKKEMVCGYAEVLKHAIIKDKKFFSWLRLNTKYIFLQEPKKLIYAIKKSCKIKLSFVSKDVDEKKLRMILNFGHTFAHAIEVKNNYSKNTTHGEAVLAGMILATKLSVIKKVCNKKTLNEIMDIYKANNLNYTFDKYKNTKEIINLIPYLKNDKKNNDEKINFILLNKIGKTTSPNKYKISINELKKIIKRFTQY